MPLDRIVTLHIKGEGTRVHGDYVPGPVADVQVWAQVSAAGFAESIEVGGIRVLARRSFLIRYRQDVITAGPAMVEITDDNDTRFGVEQMAESGSTRRRFMQITGVEST